MFCSSSASRCSILLTTTVLCHSRRGLAKPVPLSEAFCQLAAKQQEKKLPLSRPEGKAKLWQLGGWVWFFVFLLQTGKTYCEGKEEGKKDGNHAGGRPGQAASVTQGNGLAVRSGSPCAGSSVPSSQERTARAPVWLPSLLARGAKAVGRCRRGGEGSWGWVVLPILGLRWYPQPRGTANPDSQL